jgi:hypothetical protein
MRRQVWLAIFAFVAWFILAPPAVAQEEEEDLKGQLKGLELEEQLKGLEEESKQEIAEEIREDPQESVRKNIADALEEQMVEEEIEAQPTTRAQPQQQPMPKTGGVVAPSVLLPAAALLLGSSVLAYSIWRRRR